MNKLKFVAGVLGLSAAIGVGTSFTAEAGILDGALGKVIKVGGIGFLVKQFGPEINKAINTVLFQKGIKYDGKTKVVPTFSVGNGAFVGAAQVQGPPAQVDKAKYVGTIEVPLGRVRGKLMVPVESLTKSGKALKPVSGVGVSAVVDFRI